ncbi:hypothetical protein PF008_g16360 [Phytophthora fragariae]|uniref:Uncharacterized protein n=1 Tax=Phytophthora fragariae TaxID=53985 RepID=A0A6G0RBE4_9STRA|nr:hypothetical protein PF008_g16360 [Phytophthora fragariae]
MQLKVKKHVVDTTKPEQAWNRWLVKMRGETATLLIYEFGVAITRAQDLSAFKEACISPEQTDRAGATAEVSLREVVASPQEEWGTTFSGEAVIWRMWANHITRNLNRSTWEAAIELPPPDHVAHLLQLASSTMDRHVANLARSANVALDCVNGSLADYEDLRRDWNEFGQHLGRHRQNLETRRRIIEGFIRDIATPSPGTVPDPLIELENVEDVDHVV